MSFFEEDLKHESCSSISETKTCLGVLHFDNSFLLICRFRVKQYDDREHHFEAIIFRIYQVVLTVEPKTALESFY
jgi:hypothetical protein